MVWWVIFASQMVIADCTSSSDSGGKYFGIQIFACSLAHRIYTAALFQFQWLFNGNPIPGATNATYALGPLSRTNSGLYAVTITNAFGSVTSSNANVWVQVPQRLLSPQRQLDGRVQLYFSDPDGTLSADPGRFEVHHTLNPSGPTTVWTTNVGGVTTSNGRFLYVDQTSGAVSRRTYRIIER